MSGEVTCPRCRTVNPAAARFCSNCGLERPLPAAAPATPAPAQPVQAAPPLPVASKPGHAFRNIMLIMVGLFVVGAVASQVGNNRLPSGGAGGGPGGGAKITGTFVSWDPVDDSSGYALFTLHNSGAASAVAKCTISVKDDFGDFGFDSLVGETVGPGQTVSGKIPINVGKGSYKINHGEVKDC